VLFAPAAFEIQGYKGEMNSWQEFGKFQYILNSKRDELPANIIQQVNELTAGASDNAEKVKLLYAFLQKNTRYISVQLGLGGWQPIEASRVAQTGYGDCKALTNYMHSLLKRSRH
jgi:transglutaminase-like putative cysteine protease